MLALYVRNTLAERPGMKSRRKAFRSSTVMASKRLSPSLRVRLNAASARCTRSSTSTSLKYRIESLPRKSKVICLPSSSLTCSALRLQQPTVSASSSVSFSPPARKANLSMKYAATPTCVDWSSLHASMRRQYSPRTSSTWSLSLRAFSYLAMSDSALKSELAARYTYLVPPLSTGSSQVASHVAVLFSITAPHLAPSMGHTGGVCMLPSFFLRLRLRVMSRGPMRRLRQPIFGCSPRPRNKPGGSTRKLPTGCGLPSTKHTLNLASSASFFALAAAFSSLLIAFFFSRSATCHAKMGLKSHLASD
mmetsp:Transcript_9445/g.29510  ORF Transcript_9445/g.29510 Transcript_9445/m.29510 type:complete len:306 (+) Transcript_9445:644-1561(+)